MEHFRKKISANSSLVAVVLVAFLLVEALTLKFAPIDVAQKTAAMTVEALALITFFSLLNQ